MKRSVNDMRALVPDRLGSDAWTTQDWGYPARVLLIAGILLGTGLRFFELGRDSLWLDEIYSQWLIGMPVASMLAAVSRQDVHPPLFYLLAQLAQAGFGTSDFAARLVSAFAGILIIPVTYVLGRRLWGAPAGLLIAVVAAAWPANLHYSQEARMYALLALFGEASLYWQFRAVERATIGAWMGYTLALILALYTHYFAFLLVAAQGVFVAVVAAIGLMHPVRSRRIEVTKRLLLPFLASLIVSILVYLPWYRSMQQQRAQLEASISLRSSLLDAITIYSRVLNVTLARITEMQDCLAVVLILAVVLGFAAGLLWRRWVAVLYLGLCFAVPLLILGATISPSRLYPQRVFPFVIPLLPLAAGGLALAYAATLRLLWRVPAAGSVSLVLWLLLLTSVLARPIVEYYGYQKEGWRETAAYLTARGSPNDIVIADGVSIGAGDAGRVEQALPHYLGEKMPILKAKPGLVGHLPEDRRASGTAWGVIWYVGDLSDRRPLSAQFEFADFPSLLVFRLVQPSGLLWNDAIAVLNAMLELQPLPETHADLHLALAELYTRSGESALASKHLDAVSKTSPQDDQKSAVGPGEGSVALRVEAAEEASVAGDLAGARVKYAGLLAGDLKPDERFDILMRWAIMERTHENPVSAIDLLKQAIALRPDDVEAHANFGAVLLDAGRPDDSAREFEYVIGRAPDHYWAYYYGGLAYQRSGHPDKALAALQKAEKLGPEQWMRDQAAVGVIGAALELKDCGSVHQVLGVNPSLLDSDDALRRRVEKACG